MRSKVHDLQEELEAWRAYRIADIPAGAISTIEDRVREHLRQLGFGGSAICRLLLHFLDNPGRIIARDAIYEIIVNRDRDTEPKIIDVRVSQVRSVVEALGIPRASIETAWGIGYRLNTSAAAQVRDRLGLSDLTEVAA